eukprot:6466794-Amphidinium_carterae.7
MDRFIWMSKGCATVAQLLRQQRLSKSIKYMARMSMKSIVIFVLARGVVGSVVVVLGMPANSSSGDAMGSVPVAVQSGEGKRMKQAVKKVRRKCGHDVEGGNGEMVGCKGGEGGT